MLEEEKFLINPVVLLTYLTFLEASEALRGDVSKKTPGN